VESKYVIPRMFEETYAKITTGNPNWNKLSAPTSTLYPWDTSSTYIRHPPFFKDMTVDLPEKKPIRSASVLLNLGDSVTTSHFTCRIHPKEFSSCQIPCLSGPHTQGFQLLWISARQ